MAAKKVKGLSITSSREGFRRAGYAFGKEATLIKLADLNKKQIELLKGEGYLAVSEVEFDEEIVE